MQLDEVYGIMPTSFWQTPPGYAILVISGVLILGLIAYGIVRLRTISNKDQAIKALKALENETDSRKLYTELIVIVKQYSGWPVGMTDYEITQMLQEQGEQELPRIIADAQVIKFGHGAVLKKAMLKDIAYVIAYIESQEER